MGVICPLGPGCRAVSSDLHRGQGVPGMAPPAAAARPPVLTTDSTMLLYGKRRLSLGKAAGFMQSLRKLGSRFPQRAASSPVSRP